MAKNRLIYQSELLYAFTGTSCTGAHSTTAVVSGYGNYATAQSGSNFIAELYRVQNVNHSWNKQLTDVFQFGELGRIDAVSLQPPTVSLSFNYLLANLVNEKILGLTVNKAGDSQDVTCLSGILNATTDSKNYFLKIVTEGSDVIDTNTASYDVVSLGNGYLSSYRSQGSINNFPTVDIEVTALNMQAQTVTSAGAMIPAINPTDGTPVTGWAYVLPTGLTSVSNSPLTTSLGISVLRPENINLSLGLSAGDGFAAESDIKIQSYDISFNLNQEDLQKLGTKFAYAKVPTYPVSVTMTCSALQGDLQTGNLTRIIADNRSFNPTVTITSPNDSTTVVAAYKLKGAKLDSQNFASQIGSNATIDFNFTSVLSGPSDNQNGLFISGVTI